MSNDSFSASRRRLLGGTAAMATSLMITTGFASTAGAATHPAGQISGPVTFYAEFRVAQPYRANFELGINQFANHMKNNGALAITLKQMVGDSTMVKNYPESYKGLLKNAYAEAAAAGTLPLFYSLFVRFSDIKSLEVAHVDAAFDEQVLPHLHGVVLEQGKPVPSPQPMAVYRGVFQTVVAGDRQGIYTSDVEIVRFLTHPVDANPGSNLVTVENHVFIADQVMKPFEEKVIPLLKVAQQTFEPTAEHDGIGLPGAQNNRDYRKAISTEIMRKILPDGDLRAYIMHGVWESVWDHENSHLDPRFKQAAGPVGAMVEIGPVEPFYTTQLTVLKA